ncbi:MAG UNVERIFIED_CONTAM: phosphatidylglycerophosphatase A [Rickettsiaceae bacterium]|jgi:phosphatidylglycerophosphatase A
MAHYKDIVSKLIVTCFFVGKIKYAPGTFGSLVAFPINYILAILVLKSRFLLPLSGFSEIELEFITLFSILMISSIILFIVGIVFSNHYMITTNTHDPKEIVIDEVVGQMLTSTLTFLSVAFVHNSNLGAKYDPSIVDLTCFLILPFILFRACDIIKPWPINWMDKNIKGGIGVMLDDVAAAILASVLHYALIFTFI